MRKILPTFKSLVIAIMAITFQLNTIFGQVATLQDWTNVYHGSSKEQQDIPYSVPTGSNANRVLVVAIASERTPAGQLSVTLLTYGDQALTPANGDMGTSTIQHTALYYLDEAGLDAATNTTLSVTVTLSSGTIRITDVWAAVFDYVNQTTPLTDSQTYSSGTSQVTSFSFSPALTINAYNQAVEVVGSHNSIKNQACIITYATDWTMIQEQTAFYSIGFSGYSIRNGVANRSIPTSSTTDVSQTSLDRTALASMTALSLNYEAPPPPTIQASNVTFSDVTSSSFTINWDPGDGTNRLVLVKAGSAVDSDPVDGTTYTASNLFGNGSEIGTGNYVVYNGTGSSVTVDNLDANTTYHVAVYEFSGPPGLEDYLTPPARGNQLTDPETAITDDYRSNGSGNWSDAGIWQTFDGSSWVTAGSPPNSSSGIITIRNGHTITVAEAVTADQVVIVAGGQVTVNSGITWTIADGADAADCNVAGTLFNSGTVTTTGDLAFNSGSTYQHATDGGTIAAASWDANSTCLITGITATAPSGFGQSFGNFTWNCVSQTVTAAMNSDVTIKGNFRITSTGSGKLAIIDNNTSRTVTLTGNYYHTAGSFVFNNGSSSSASAYLYVAGNFSFTGGSITELSSGRGSIIFNGNGAMQTYTSGGALSNTIDFAVGSGAYLQMGTGLNPSIISISNGTFTLSSGATLGITDRYGITASTTGPFGGNIRVTGTRNFDTGANYIYNGSVTQNTGNGLPLTINSLVFNNTVGAVTFNSARTITNDFSITTGSKANLGTFTHTTSLLILGGVGQPSGSYGHSSSPATYKNDIYFDAATGIVNNAPPAGTWLGSVSDDWNTTENWVGDVPTSGTNATVSSYTANQPVISGTTTALCNTVTIGSGASLTIASDGKATITSLTNNGTLNLESDADGIASLILDSYNDNGTENIQLYLTGGGDESTYAWHYISSPVQSLSTDVFTDITWDLARFVESLPASEEPYSWQRGWVGFDGWSYYDESSTPYGFSTLDLGKGYNYWHDAAYTYNISGTINTTSPSQTLTYTGSDPVFSGNNLLGNPYTCGLNIQYIMDNAWPANVLKSVWFTSNNVSYVYSNEVGVPSTADAGIPPMQGFFVKAAGSPGSFSFPLSAREHNSTARYKGDKSSIPLVRLSVSENGKSGETVVRFNEFAKPDLDLDFDAPGLFASPDDPSIYSSVNGVDYAINGIPFPVTSVEIPVTVKLLKEGTHSIRVIEIQELGNYNVILTDKSTNFSADLKSVKNLAFTAPAGLIRDRFVLTVTNISTGIEATGTTENLFNIYHGFNVINIQPLADEWDGKTGSIKVIDLSGKTFINQQRAEFRKNTLIQLPSPGTAGLYFIEIRSGIMKHLGKVVIR